MKTQAWGWLTAAVLAAGLNASYHDGGLEWAHRVADRVEHNSAAVLALASGHAGQFLAEARLVSDQVIAQPAETPSCPWSTAIARAQARMAHAQTSFAHLETMSAREQAHWAHMETNQERLEARVAAQTARLRATVTAFNPVAFKTMEIPTRCRTIRVNVPQMPAIHIPAPDIQVSMSSDPI